jgi:hypothetical protein
MATLFLYNSTSQRHACAASIRNYETSGTQFVEFGVTHPWFQNRGDAASEAEQDYHNYRKHLESVFEIEVVKDGVWRKEYSSYPQLVFLATLIRHPIEVHTQSEVEKLYPRIYSHMQCHGLSAFGALMHLMPSPPPSRLKHIIFLSLWNEYIELYPETISPWDCSVGHGLFEAATCFRIIVGTELRHFQQLSSIDAFKQLAKEFRPIGTLYAQKKLIGYCKPPQEI